MEKDEKQALKQCMDAVLAQSQRSMFAEQGVDLETTRANPLAKDAVAAAAAAGGTGRPPASARAAATAQSGTLSTRV